MLAAVLMKCNYRVWPWPCLIALGVLGTYDKLSDRLGCSSGSSGSGAVSGGSVSGLCDTSVNGSYKLPADRVTTWTMAGMLTKGGIPSAAWPVCNAVPLAPSGGGDDSTAINNL